MHDGAQVKLKGLAMRDLVLALSLLATVFYFLVNQDQFRELLAWLTIMIP
jgi:hypothetical protein